MFSIKPVEEVARTVVGFDVHFTPEQLLYVTAVLGWTVTSGSVPKSSAGLYDALKEQLVEAGLLVEAPSFSRPEENTNEAGIPYSINLFKHLGLKKV